MMRTNFFCRISLLLLTLVSSSCQSSGLVFKDNPVLIQFLQKVGCEQNLKNNEWCAFWVRQDQRETVSFPSTPQAYLGLTLPMSWNDMAPTSNHFDLADSGVGLLILGPQQARLMDIIPENAEKKKELELLKQQIVDQLKGKGKKPELSVSQGINDLLQNRVKNPGYPEYQSEAGPYSELYQVNSPLGFKLLLSLESQLRNSYINVFLKLPYRLSL